ncbi:type I-B CRISPR-associated endonuclease Cas1b [Scopulibacillus cellulosilyticus]|uniref:CRISPR-associated endonuclease Cas1 n=1 Tax=Scopulibacillus cellulosilyticus TaxID=2665665 RepID=A0ABW2Q3G7_9BACL
MLRDHYIFNNGRLKRKHNTVYFAKNDGEEQSLPVEKIRNLHLFGEVDFNSKLLNFLSKHDIVLHIYNYYGYYSGTYYPRKKNVSGFSLVNQSAHYLDNYKRMFLAVRFLQGGVHHMLRNLRRYKEKTAPIIAEMEMEAMKMQVAETIQELMGVEGCIRQHYYRALNDVLKYDFVFEKREKHPPRDPLNALISFGNTMMYRTVLSEIHRTSLDPTISYLHEPSTKRFSLSLDIAEIFKPLIVDPIIISLINKRGISKKHFSYIEGEICYLNDEGKKKFITRFEERLKQSVKHRTLKRQTTYRYMIRLECYKLIKHLINDEIYKPLKAWW